MSANGSFVYVVKQDSTAEQRPVTLGQRQGELVVVENGVAAGEHVVTAGQLGSHLEARLGSNSRLQPQAPGRSNEFIGTLHSSTRDDGGVDLSVVLFGILSYRQLPVNDLPQVDYPLSRCALVIGASPDTIANNIATPLERQFMQINGLEVVTRPALRRSNIHLQFALEKSIDAAATDVQTAISQSISSLPPTSVSADLLKNEPKRSGDRISR
jgi:hypothetical protein